MNTPAHLLLGAALLARRGKPRQTSAALVGAAVPDLSLYVLAGSALFILNISPEVVFGELYFSPPWQLIFAIDNSIPLFAALLGVSIWRGWSVMQVFSVAALLHIAFDLPLHHDDGRPHFWPFTDWVYTSPVSYWDSAQSAGYVVPLTLTLAVACAVVLWRRFPAIAPRLGVAALLAAEIWVSRQWLLFF